MIEDILLEVIGTSIIGAICIILFCFLSWILQRRYSARVRKNIWIMIAICLLLPVNRVQLPYTYTVEIPNIVIKEYDNLSVTQQSISHADFGNEIEKTTQKKEDKNEDGAIEITTQTVLFVMWSFFVAVLLIYYMLGYLKMWKKAKRWSDRCQDEKIEKIVKEIAFELKIKHIPNIRIMKNADRVPFTAGIVRKVVFLPNEKWLEKDLYYILKHELVHCKERDILWKMLFLVVNVVHWFNPFVWVMRKFAENDMEQVCDEVVLKEAISEERREYSEIIMSWVEKSNPKGSALTTSYMSGILFLKWRFANILGYNHKKKGIILVMLIGISIAIISSLINISGERKIYHVNRIEIDSGIEVRTDLDGDGENDRVRVIDVRSGDIAYSQIIARIGEEDVAVKNYEGFFESMIVAGDFLGNGKADILLVRLIPASIHQRVEFSVLHYDNGAWLEYPCTFIHNLKIEKNQPDNFISTSDFLEYQAGGIYCGATIVEENEKTLLRCIIALLEEDISGETVLCIDASYQADGWYIEEIERVENYYRDRQYKVLLKNNY